MQGTREARAYDLGDAGREDVDYKNMAVLEKREMEQQVEFLHSEKVLGAAGHRLGQCVVHGITQMRQTN